MIRLSDLDDEYIKEYISELPSKTTHETADERRINFAINTKLLLEIKELLIQIHIN